MLKFKSEFAFQGKVTHNKAPYLPSSVGRVLLCTSTIAGWKYQSKPTPQEYTDSLFHAEPTYREYRLLYGWLAGRGR